MKTRWTVLLLAVASCAKSIDGPTPTVTAARSQRDQTTAPAYLCNAQGDTTDGWLIDALGDAFAPLVTDVLSGTPAVQMPEVALAGPASYQLPKAWVRFDTRNRMPLAMRTADTALDPVTLAPGDYSLTITNPGGRAGTLANAVRVVPPPVISSVSLSSPSGGAPGTRLCADSAQTLVITGANFRTDLKPDVQVGPHLFSGASITALAAGTVSVSIPANTFTAAETSAAGTNYTVTLTNPDGCRAPYGGTLSVLVTAYPTCKALGALSVTPRFGYQLRDTPITLTNTFNAPATQPFSGALPKISILAPLASGGPALAIPLRSVAFVDQHTVTAVVPVCSGTSFGARSGATPSDCPGLAPGGPYDLLVVDPISGQGLLTAAFTVVASPPPVISSLSPASITTGGGAVVVAGAQFDATSSVLLGTPVAGGVEFCPVAVGARAGTTSLTATVPGALGPAGCYVEDAAGNHTAAAAGFSLGIDQFLVRVQHGSDLSFTDYAALVVTGSAFNPVDRGVASSTLVTARGQAGAGVAFDDLGQPYFYVAGGSTTGADALASVEVAPVGLFGDLGGVCAGASCKFRVLDRTPLPAARAGLQLVARSVGGAVGTSYLYAIGGRTAAPANLNEVWRAQVLRSQDAPTMRQVTSAVRLSGGPGAGTWYYKVAALFPVGSPLNAAGAESLPSDEESIQLNDLESGVVKFGCVAGATKYRIYRSDAAQAVSNAEAALADVAAACTGTAPGLMSFTDDGSVTPDPAKRPLPAGALGAWVNTGVTLGTARFDHQARVVPGATSDIVVLGGCTSASGTGCAASTNSIEKLSFTSGTDLDPAQAATAGSGLTARDRFGVGIATAGNANVSAGKAFLLVFGGETNGAEISGNATIQAADLATLAFSNSTGAPQNIGVGGWADVVSNQGFSEATRTNNHTLFSKSGSLGAGPFSLASDFNLNLNAGVPPYSQGGTRFLPGEQLFRAFVYVAAGFTADNAFTPTNTVERFVY
jgi:hypothetical protein